MKILRLAVTALVLTGLNLSAQTRETPPVSDQAGQVKTTPYQAAATDGNSTVWERADDASVTKTSQKHRYIQLEAGLNHLVNGEWVPSTENIEMLPDGSAAATNGQHQAYFPGDIYESAITVVTPGGQILQSRPFILVYTDGTGSEIIGELKSSPGEFAASNQVVYPDAFEGIKADIRYTYTKSGFEQDIILRQRPPAPESLGLDPAKTRIEVLTEFFDPPAPEQKAGVIDRANKIQDTNIKLGDMVMIPGRAFATRAANQKVAEGALVFKDWLTVQDRTFLVEKLPYASIALQLETLPLQASLSLPSRPVKLASGKLPGNLILPPSRPVKASTGQVLLAKVDYNRTPGVVLDYVLLGSTVGNFTFQADTTYLMSGSFFQINGLATFEGGTVIKFASTSSGFQLSYGGISCLSGPYRPIILTAIDDNTVGETISGSTGNPSGYYGNGINIYGNGAIVLHDIRMSYLNAGINVFPGSFGQIDNFQAINCNNPFTHSFASLTLNNGLFYNIGNIAVLSYGSATSVSGTQLTIDTCTTFADSTTPSLTLANSLVTATTTLLAGSGTLTTNKVTILASNSGIFQTVGAGSHYLANSSSYRGAGTNNINASVLASLAARTTYPPLVYSNQTFTVSTNLQLQAQRDTNTLPDLGYHYDPLDYITDNVTVTNTTLTITNGIAIACYNEPGIILQAGAAINSIGTPLLPNWLVRYQSVQDKSVFLGGASPGSGQNVAAASLVANRPSASFQFTHFASPASGGFVFNHAGNSSFNTLTVKHSEIWGGTNDFSGPTNAAVANLLNNVFFRSGITASNPLATATGNLAFTNNLIYGSALSLIKPAAGSWYFFNNDVDSCTIDSRSVITNGYNAFINCSTNLIGTSNLVTTNVLNYQSGPLGTFYQPTNSPLIDLGSVAADLLTLGHFTTRTNQTIESNSIADIGYHYVALGTNGLPLLDTNGVPFYVEDGNPSQAPVIAVQPVDYSAVLTSNAIFTVTATGALPLKYKWRLNVTNVIAGATNASLNFNSVQLTNAGSYTVVITNNFGAVTSSIAVLTVVTKPVITSQPANYSARQGGPATFSVTTVGVSPLRYQWRFNATNVVAGATNANLILNNVQATNAGNYSVIVTNTYGAVTSTPAILTVLLPPIISLAGPANGQLFPAYPTNITLTATASDPSGGVVTNVSFYSNATTLLGSLTVSPYVYVWSGVSAGVYQISAVAADNSGLSTTSSVATIVVDTPPAATITTPLNGTVINSSSNLNINATAADVDGSVTQLQIYAGATLLGTSATSPYGLVWTNVPSGLWNLRAVAFDNYGVGATSSIVSISVNNNTNTLPAIADAYVRDGIYTNNNYGTNAVIEVQIVGGNGTNGTNRFAFFKFDVSTLPGNINSAKFRVFASLDGTGSVTNTVYGPTNNDWNELTLTWSNKPSRINTLTTNIISGTNGAWYEYDVTGFVASQIAAGQPLVSLSLYDPVNTTNLMRINSRENASNQPSLVVILTNSLPSAPVIVTQPVDTTGFFGSNAMFSVTATGNPAPAYQWWFNGTNLLLGATNSILVLTNLQATNAGVYSVVVSNALGTVTSSGATLTVTVADSDFDGLSDSFESTVTHTDPNNPDTDGDGISDFDEYLLGLNPLVANPAVPVNPTIQICPQ